MSPQSGRDDKLWWSVKSNDGGFKLDDSLADSVQCLGLGVSNQEGRSGGCSGRGGVTRNGRIASDNSQDMGHRKDKAACFDTPESTYCGKGARDSDILLRGCDVESGGSERRLYKREELGWVARWGSWNHIANAATRRHQQMGCFVFLMRGILMLIAIGSVGSQSSTGDQSVSNQYSLFVSL